MTQGDGKGGRPQSPAGSGTSRKPDPAAQRQAKIQGWGCVTLFGLLIAGGVLWGLYDEGVFEKKAAKDAPVFGPEQAGRLVEQLSAAADAQGVCYGWVIDSGRSREIKQVTPSYSGTFRPHPPKQAPQQAPRQVPGQATPSPAVQAGAGSGSAASPAPRPTATGTRPPASAPTSVPTPTPTPTRDGHFSMSEEIEYDLEQLDEFGVEFGSNLGLGKDPRQVPGQCPKWVILEARFSYSESYSEYSLGRFEIKNSFDERFRETTFERRLGQVGEDDIDGESGTARLRDAIGALPMLVASEGLAPPVPAETRQAAQVPPNDKLSESSVTARTVWSVIGIGLVAVALVVIVIGAVRSLRRSGS
ncbi:hypothetical protein [Spirillospora sp. NPDC048819]|uniref:hypothetical protein n=1 Tax=Spirillospora sp. NPDC048819 TaxID=3155268 RepID=UPI00340E3890